MLNTLNGRGRRAAGWLRISMARAPILVAVAIAWASPLAAQSAVDLPATDRPIRVESEHLFTIGGLGAPDWAAFARVDEVAFDANGRLYVLDRRNQRVVVVGPDGRLVRRIGYEGGGPGEFLAPADIAVFPSGELVVVDVIQKRLSRFDSAGDLIDDVPAVLGEGAPVRIFPHPSGDVLGDARVYQLNGRYQVRTSGGFRDTDNRPIQHYVVAGDGDARLVYRARLIERPTDARGRPYLSAFLPEFRWTVLPDGRAVLSDTSAYLLTVLAPDGAVERLLRRPLADRPITEAIRERERQRLLDAFAEGRPPESTVTFGRQPPSPEEMERRHRRRIDEMRFPDVFPHVHALAADFGGRLWVERTGEDPHGPGPIDVLTAEGRYLGTLPAGEPGMPAAFGPNGLAAYVTLDELDVPSVRVMRLRLSLPN